MTNESYHTATNPTRDVPPLQIGRFVFHKQNGVLRISHNGEGESLYLDAVDEAFLPIAMQYWREKEDAE